jgi:DNA-directed RNA polymerase beta' subunit
MPTSFTVGSGDIEVSQEIDDSVQKVIDTELLEIQHMITEAETSTVLHDVDIIEPIFQGKMDNVRENVGKAVGKSLSKSNAFSVMEVSGAKGSVLNTAQMMACVGQQAIEAKRVVKRVNGRTLAHYHQDDDSGPARGFIRNNYYKGLTPQEFIFHMMSGREGMIDTAIKTAETGYIQRRLVKALEDLQVLYDATVRTAGGTLLQPLYGYNGIDPSMQAQLRIGLIAANNDDVRKRYCFENEAEAKKHGLSARENEEHYSNLLGMRNQMRDIQRKTSWSAAVLNETITSPVKFDHLIRKWRARSGDYKRESPLDARYVFASIEKMLSHEFTPMYRISQQDLKSEGCIKLRDEQLAKTFLRTILHEYLSPKRCIVEYGFGRERFDELCREAVKKFHMSRIQPGTMVGVICAQSVGQPATQMSTVSGTRMIIMRKRKDENGQSGIYVGPIGTFIDDLVKQNKKYTADLGHDSVETALKQLSEDYYVASLQSDETIKWCKISHVSRHPTNGKLVRMKTASGREITATPSHSFLKRTESSFEAVPAKNLKLGDRMPVAKDLPQFCKTKLTQYKLPGSKFTLQLDRLTGWFFGAYLADGNLHAIGSSIKITKVAPEYQKTVFKFVKERLGVEYRVEERDRRVKDWKKYSHKVYHGESIIFNHKDLSEILHKVCGTGSFVKRVPFFVHMAPKEFIAGMLQGYMDGDGNVSSNRNVHHHTASKVKNNRNSIRTSSVNHRMTTEFALLFNYMGIYPSICKEKASDPNGDGRERAPLHTLQIPYKYAETFKRKIGSCYKARLEDLDNMIAYGRSGKHNDQEYIDKIPKLGACIARLAKNLYRSRAAKEYERWKRKDSIGRRTLQKYITVFEEQMVKFRKTVAENGGYITVNRGSGTVDVDIGARELSEMQTDLETLKQAADSHVVWDAITELEYIEDPKEYVYDFTVPGTETFMIANGMFTHNTLNTFHSAGVAGKSIGNLGVPRLRELMAYSKNPKTPRMTIPLKAEYENRLDIVQSIASELKYTVMNDITKSVQVIWDPDPSDPKSYMQIDQADNIYYGSKCQHDIAGLPWLMRIVLNPEGMLNSGIQLLDIKSRFCTFWGNRVKEIKKLKKKEEKHALDKVTRMAILSNYSTSKEIVIHIRYDTTGVNFNNHMALADLVMHRFKLKGIDGITAVDIDEEQYKAVDERGGLVDKKRYVIHTEGVNLVNIRYLNFIDIPRVVTNHVVDIYAVMGIEAARAATKLEYKKVIEGSGAEADYRHLALLSDFSTNTGNLVPVDRHGMTKSDAEFLAKATNEMTVEQLVDAAFYRQSANMQNVSSRIMTGMAFNGGSNAAKIFIDFDELEKCEYIPEESAKGKRFNALTANHMIDDIIRETERQEAGGSDSDVSND